MKTYRGVMHVHSYLSHDSEGTLYDLTTALRSSGYAPNERQRLVQICNLHLLIKDLRSFRIIEKELISKYYLSFNN